MKRFVALFSESYGEFRHVGTITAAALFGAISVVIGYFTIAIGNYIKIGFSTIANQMVYYLFGPVVGIFFGGALDILKYFIKPTGPFFAGFTFNAMVAGLIYGMIYYKKPLSLTRVFLAELTVSVVCNMLLGTYWLTIIYGKGFFVLLPARALKNLLMLPINSIFFYGIANIMEHAGIVRLFRDQNIYHQYLQNKGK